MNGISKLNETEVRHFSRLIRTRLRELDSENALGQQGQSIVELDQQAVGRLSRMDALQNQAMSLAQQNRRDQQARLLLEALVRIEEGEFGYCEDCGEDIAQKRLELNPAATKCISCASG